MAAMGRAGVTAPRLDPDALAALEEQRAFLRRSLDDLDREHDAGDLDAADHASLRADYEARLAALSTAVADGRAAFAATRRPRHRRRPLLVTAAVLLVALACGFGVAQLAGRRTAGDTATGESRQDPRSLLTECLADATGSGGSEQTVACYDAVLRIDPNNVEAKTYRAGIQLMANGDTSQIATLIDVATANPSYPDAHAFLAVAFDRIGRPESALAELRKLDGLSPSPFVTDLVADLRSGLEAALASTTTTTTTTP
jgi:cytochrome c-type biogenesis protein CcmI